MVKTPVLVIGYARPEYLKAVLKLCPYDREYLFVCDGAKRESDQILIETCRALMSNFNCIKKTLIFRSGNLGGPIGIPDAIDKASLLFTNFIVLEDDTLPSVNFFEWVDCCVSNGIFDNKNILLISGTNIPSALLNIDYEKSQLSIFPHTWGWATSSNNWKKIRNISQDSIDNFELRDLIPDDLVLQYWNDLRKRQNERATWNWDYRLCYCMWIMKQFVLIPPVNLISNVGVGAQSQNNSKINILNYLQIKQFNNNSTGSEFDQYSWTSHDYYDAQILVRRKITKLRVIWIIIINYFNLVRFKINNITI